MTYPDSPQEVVGTRTLLVALTEREQSTQSGRLPEVQAGEVFWARTDQAAELVASGLRAQRHPAALRAAMDGVDDARSRPRDVQRLALSRAVAHPCSSGRPTVCPLEEFGRSPGRQATTGRRLTPTGNPVTPHKTLREVQGGCLWPVGQITCRHEWDLEACSQLSRVLGHLCAVIDDAAQTAIVALVVPLDQEIHPVGEVL
jgi:hypothetical protein